MKQPTDGAPLEYLIERVPPPAWLTDGSFGLHDADALEDVSGNQIEWGFAIPWMYRVLASPRSGERMLESPRFEGAPGVLAYWAALVDLLVYSFGWCRPDRGLRWWYDAGKPTADPCLALVSQVWVADGLLDGFAAWLWTRAGIYPVDGLQEYATHAIDDEPVRVDPAWLANARANDPGIVDWFGSGDALHLSNHYRGPIEEPTSGVRLVRVSETERKAVLLLDSMVGWYRALVDEGGTLPGLDLRSWRVDVVVRPIGTLGTFRRSRTTGLWFTGRHSLHLRGV